MKEKGERDVSRQQQSHEVEISAIQEKLSTMKLLAKECSDHSAVTVDSSKGMKNNHHAMAKRLRASHKVKVYTIKSVKKLKDNHTDKVKT